MQSKETESDLKRIKKNNNLVKNKETVKQNGLTYNHTVSKKQIKDDIRTQESDMEKSRIKKRKQKKTDKRREKKTKWKK